MNKLGLLVPALLMSIASNAHAADKTATVGNRLNAIINDNWNAVFLLVAIASAVAGLFLLCKGLVALVAATSQREKPSTGLTLIFIGILLVSLPDVAGIGGKSILGMARGGATLGSAELDYSDKENGAARNLTSALLGAGTPDSQEPANCLSSSTPAHCIAGNLANAAAPQAIFAIYALAMIAGFILIARELLALARNASGQQHGQGFLVRIGIGVLLMNAPYLFQILTYTILGSDQQIVAASGSLNSSSTLLEYKMSGGAQALQQMSGLIGHLFTILAVAGTFAFVRGIFMLKAVSEGRGQGSYGAALVFMAGGILLANMKATAAMFATTAGFPGII